MGVCVFVKADAVLRIMESRELWLVSLNTNRQSFMTALLRNDYLLRSANLYSSITYDNV